jgi:DICT domain-containing protein
MKQLFCLKFHMTNVLQQDGPLLTAKKRTSGYADLRTEDYYVDRRPAYDVSRWFCGVRTWKHRDNARWMDLDMSIS